MHKRNLLLKSDTVFTMKECVICGKSFSRADNLKRHMKIQHKDENDETDDDEVEKENGSQADDEDVPMEVDTNEDTPGYVDNVFDEVYGKHEETLAEYVTDPETVREMSTNRDVETFFRLKIIDRFVEDYSTYVAWRNDPTVAQWAKDATKLIKSEGIEDDIAIKRVLRKDDTIMDWVHDHLEEVGGDEEEDDEVD